MNNQIFFSWQTDTPAECNKTLIRKAIEDAIDLLKTNIEVEDALRVESGMEGTPGTPEVASIMFEKISNSAIFICDVTLVGSIDKGDTKKLTANPNVLIEMGYAASTIGWERVICVMNEYYGKRTDQPFDIRNRRFPIDYTLEPGKTPKSSQKNLSKWLSVAISGILEFDNMLVEKAINRLNINCLNLMASNGKSPWFSDPNPSGWTIGGILSSPRYYNAIDRLLDIGMLKTDVNPSTGQYAYHWTYLGKEVLGKLKLS